MVLSDTIRTKTKIDSTNSLTFRVVNPIFTSEEFKDLIAKQGQQKTMQIFHDVDMIRQYGQFYLPCEAIQVNPNIGEGVYSVEVLLKEGVDASEGVENFQDQLLSMDYCVSRTRRVSR